MITIELDSETKVPDAGRRAVMGGYAQTELVRETGYVKFNLVIAYMYYDFILFNKMKNACAARQRRSREGSWTLELDGGGRSPGVVAGRNG